MAERDEAFWNDLEKIVGGDISCIRESCEIREGRSATRSHPIQTIKDSTDSSSDTTRAVSVKCRTDSFSTGLTSLRCGMVEVDTITEYQQQQLQQLRNRLPPTPPHHSRSREGGDKAAFVVSTSSKVSTARAEGPTVACDSNHHKYSYSHRPRSLAALQFLLNEIDLSGGAHPSHPTASAKDRLRAAKNDSLTPDVSSYYIREDLIGDAQSFVETLVNCQSKPIARVVEKDSVKKNMKEAIVPGTLPSEPHHQRNAPSPINYVRAAAATRSVPDSLVKINLPSPAKKILSAEELHKKEMRKKEAIVVTSLSLFACIFTLIACWGNGCDPNHNEHMLDIQNLLRQEQANSRMQQLVRDGKSFHTNEPSDLLFQWCDTQPRTTPPHSAQEEEVDDDDRAILHDPPIPTLRQGTFAWYSVAKKRAIQRPLWSEEVLPPPLAAKYTPFSAVNVVDRSSVREAASNLRHWQRMKNSTVVGVLLISRVQVTCATNSVGSRGM